MFVVGGSIVQPKTKNEELKTKKLAVGEGFEPPRGS
jgi:hypothetical protein